MAMLWCVWQSVSRRLNERVVISGRASCREGSRMKSLVLVLVFLAWFVTPAIADFDAGMAAYQRGDYVTAFREFKPLAEKGAAQAQNILGVMYDKSQGVPQDYVQAHMWFNLAAAQGVKQAAEARDRLAPKMSSAQIEEAQRLAREWKPKKRRGYSFSSSSSFFCSSPLPSPTYPAAWLVSRTAIRSRCCPDSRVLNRELGAAGLAWWYRQYSKDESLGKLAAEARAT